MAAFPNDSRGVRSVNAFVCELSEFSNIFYYQIGCEPVFHSFTWEQDCDRQKNDHRSHHAQHKP